MSNNGKIVKNSFYVIGGVIISGLLIFLVIALVARYLEPSAFGLFTLLLSIVSVIQLFADGGIVSITIKDISVDQEKLSRYVGSTVVGLLGLSTLITLSVVGFLFYNSYELEFSLTLVVMLLAGFVALQGLIYGAAIRAKEEMEITALVGICHKALLVVLVSVAIFIDSGIEGVAIAHLLANMTHAFVLARIVNKRYCKIKYVVSLEHWKTTLGKSIPLGVSMVLRRITIHLDIFILTMLATTYAVGLYSSAYRVLQMVEIAAIAFGVVLLPVFSKLAVKSKKDVSNLYGQVLLFLIFVSAPLAIWFYLSAENLIDIVFGEKYHEAFSVLQLLGLAMLFIIPASVFHPVFTSLGRQIILMYVAIIALALNIILDVWLIPMYGHTGAAIGTASTECLIWILVSVLLWIEGVGVKTPLKIIGIVFAAAVAAFVYTLLPNDSGVLPEIARTICFVLTYFTVLYLLRVYTVMQCKDLVTSFKKAHAKPLASRA